MDLRAVTLGLYAPELLLLVAIDIFLVLSLLTCLLEEDFPAAVPYLLQLAALAGFGQIYVSREFLAIFSQDNRFLYCLSYLVLAVASVVASNLYMIVVRREVAKGFLFSGSVSAPAIIFSVFFVSVYSHEVQVPFNLFPNIPLSLVPFAISLSISLIAVGILLSTKPNLLQTLRVGRGITVSSEEATQEAVKVADKAVGPAKKRSTLSPRRGDPCLKALRGKTMKFNRILRDKEAEGYDVSEFKELGQWILEDIRGGDIERASKMLDKVIERLQNLGPEVPLSSTVTDQQQIIEEKKEMRE